MLQLLRGKKSGLFVKIALVLITIGFSFFGIESYFVSNTSTAVAKVDGTEIGQDQFRDRFNQYRQRMQQMMGESVDPSYFARPEIRRQVLDQVVNEQLLLDANEKLGISVSPAKIRQEIMGIPAFLTDGHFDADQYKLLLASQGMSPIAFEQRVRQDLAVRELPTQLTETAIVTDADVDTYLRLKDQLRDFRFIKLAKPEPANEEIAAADIEAYYKAHQADFMVPERVAVDYLELDGSKLEVNQHPDDSVLKDRYEKEKARFASPEQRLASHILVKVEGKGTPDDQKNALAKAEAIEQELKAGKSFADLAKKDSDDLGSKNLGGDLGWLDKGTTDEAFETALFALDKGQVSEPVLSSEGYHIIELRDIRADKTHTFEEVKPELERGYADSERDRVYAEKAGKLTDLTYQDPTTLESAAHALDLSVQKTALFSRQGGVGVAATPAVVKAAFSDGVLVQSNNSDPIEIGPNHIVVIRIAEHKPATPTPIDEVRDQVRSQIVAERVAEKAKANAEALLADLNKGETLEQLAAAPKLEVSDQKGIGRDAATVDSVLVKTAFAMPHPQAGKPDNQMVDLGADVYALIQLDKVTDGDPAKLDAKTREAARTALSQGDGAEAANGFVDALRNGAKIQVFEDRMQDQ